MMNSQGQRFILSNYSLPDPSDLATTNYYENRKKECDSCGFEYFLDKFNSEDPDGYCDNCRDMDYEG